MQKMQKVNRLKPMAERYIPVAQVSFHGENVCYQLRGVQKDYDSPYDPTDVLLSVNTNKTMDAPAGTFSITLAGDGWFKNSMDGVGLKSNDLVVISLGYKAKNRVVQWLDGTQHSATDDLDTVMVGLIDTITRTRNGGGGTYTPSIQTMIVGRDFGKILIKSVLKFYPQLGTNTEGQKFFLTETGWITLLKAFTNDNAIKGSPAKILDTILRYILTQICNIRWKVYDTNSYIPGSTPGYREAYLGSIMEYVFAKTNFFIPFFMSAQEYEGSIWNLMSKVNIKPFTELFIDTRDRWEVGNSAGVPQLVNETVEERSTEDKGSLAPLEGRWERPGVMFGPNDGGQVVLTFRNTPFDPEAWNKLRLHEIDTVDIIQDTLSYSDNENYNLFWAGTTLTPFSTLDLKAVNPPLINQDNIERYGLSPLEIHVEGLELDKTKEDEQTIALEGLSSTLSAKLKSWFENNLSYLSGSLTVRGKGNYKIGQRLKYETREFYIESVGQNFQIYGTWQAQLGVTRGAQVAPPVAYDGDAAKAAAASVTTADVAASSQTTAQVESSYYTVVSGDTLWGIALAKLGDGNRWTELWELNKDTLIARDARNESDTGHWIYPGMSLRIT